MARRLFVDAPAGDRCAQDIRLRDGSMAQCGRHRKVGQYCTQHATAPARSRGRPRLDDDERMVLVRTRLLPGSVAAVRRIAEEHGITEAAALRELVEGALEARGEARCRSCGADIAGMVAYRVGEPRERCDACEESITPPR